MAVTTIDPGWSGGAWRFRIPDVVGQIAIAIVGAGLATYAAFELTMMAYYSFTGHGEHTSECGLYAGIRMLSNAGAMIVSVIPNIVWSCWRRRLSLRRALLTSAILGAVALTLISLGFFASPRMLLDVALHAPGVIPGCLTVALTMLGWHRLWMRFAQRAQS